MSSLKSILLCPTKKRAFMIIMTLFGYYLYTKRAKPNKTIPLMPDSVPYFGHLLRMLFKKKVDYNEGLKRVSAMNSPVVHNTFAFRYNTVFIVDPFLVKWCFDDKFELFEKSTILQENFAELLGNGIFVSDPPDWKFHRKVASRMFSMRNLKTYMFNTAKKGVNRWMNKIEELRLNGNSNGVIDIYELFARFTLDVFVEIAFGNSLNIIESAPKTHKFAESFDKSVGLIAWRFRDPSWKIKRFLNISYERDISRNVTVIDKFADDMINNLKDHKSELTDETGKKKHNILSLFLEYDNELTNNQLRDIAMNFIIAGRDTTRLLLSWFLYVLSLNKECELKILNEIKYFYENETEITYDNIQNSYDINNNNKKYNYWKYLEACLCETLRMYPVVPFLYRFAKNDVKLPGNKGFIINKGEAIVIPTWIYGKLSTVWGDNAAKFDPMRFYNKGINQYPQEKFVFFNINPRLCLGRKIAMMEAKLVAINFLRKYRYEIINRDDVEVMPAPVLNMKNGMKIRIYPRDNITP